MLEVKIQIQIHIQIQIQSQIQNCQTIWTQTEPDLNANPDTTHSLHRYHDLKISK